MADSAAQPQGPADGAHLVLYDGVCGLCDHLLQFLLRHDRRRVFHFASLQSGTGKAMVARCGGNPHELTTFYVVADYRSPRSRAFTRSDAALFVAGQLGWPWKGAGLLRVLPRSLRDRAYDIVARLRYRVFGRFEHCLLPRPEFRSRFVD
jgi:predicted DCC family thiol-disulfide oxidoreductase YuxK